MNITMGFNEENEENAPKEAVITARLISQGKSYSDIAEQIYGSREPKNKQKVSRNIKQWIRDFPHLYRRI